jgi:hypothetical protein
VISASEFGEWLGVLCLGQGASLPRKLRDRHILFRSIVQFLAARPHGSEAELNGGIGEWLREVGEGIDVDHVTLRRYLVDARYLVRDPDGSEYRLNVEGDGTFVFEAGVSDLDSVVLVREAREREEARRRAWRDR